MATKKVIDIIVNTSEAEKSTDDLKDSFKGLNTEIEESNDLAKQSIENTSKASKKASKNVGFLGKSFKKLGTVIKATGIGLIVALVASLTIAFSKNQKVMNLVNTVFESISIVLSKVTDALISVYESVSKNTENFNALGKVINGLLTLAVTPLKLAFYGIKLAIQEGQLAWEKSFFGGKDKDKIKELTLSIEETKQNLIDVGKEAIQSGKDVFNNFSEAVDEIGNITNKVIDEVSKISIKASIEQAKTNVMLRNSAKLAVAEQGRLIEKYDRLAEIQRQIRDDESKSITERIKANEKLGEILEKQEKSMLAQARAQIASAQADLNKNKTIENQVALTEALANKEAILAQIEGFRSEQLVNRIALQKEEIQLNNTISDAEKQRQIDWLEFQQQIAKTESEKIEKIQERLDLENEIIAEDLERKRELYVQGTQDRVDAEQEYLDKKQELLQSQLLLDQKRSEEEIKLNEKVAQAKSNIANRTTQLLIQLAGRGSKLGKAIAVANTIRSGIEGVQSAYTTAQKSPITALFPGYPLVQAGLAGAFSALQVRELLKTSDTATGGATSSPPPTNAPSFNLVQGTPTNQIAESITNQNEKPIQTYVTSGEVETAAALDRNRVEEGSF